MTGKAFYIGSVDADGVDGPTKGWLVGSFIDDSTRHSDAVEIKYWKFPAGETTHDTKVSNVLEVTFVLTGEVSGEIDDQPVKLTAGEYMVIPAGVKNNVPMNVQAAASGITIKAPSDTSQKTVVED
jgi:quercetin dioxygenase-like cupin family protein